MRYSNYILIVDDDQDTVDLLKECIKQYSEHTMLLSYQNVNEFLEQINKDDLPSLIILDINLPGISGLDLLWILRADPTLKRVPTVVFSDGGNPSEKSFCIEQGVELIEKPANMRQWKMVAKKMLQFCKKSN